MLKDSVQINRCGGVSEAALLDASSPMLQKCGVDLLTTKYTNKDHARYFVSFVYFVVHTLPNLALDWLSRRTAGTIS